MHCAWMLAQPRGSSYSSDCCFGKGKDDVGASVTTFCWKGETTADRKEDPPWMVQKVWPAKETWFWHGWRVLLEIAVHMGNLLASLICFPPCFGQNSWPAKETRLQHCWPVDLAMAVHRGMSPFDGTDEAETEEPERTEERDSPVLLRSLLSLLLLWVPLCSSTTSALLLFSFCIICGVIFWVATAVESLYKGSCLRWW